MINVVVYVTDKYKDSGKFSLQQTHLELYVQGKLRYLELRSYDNEFLCSYTEEKLGQVMSSALARGHRWPAAGGDPYYLADRI
jgi:hypothetical protein